MWVREPCTVTAVPPRARNSRYYIFIFFVFYYYFSLGYRREKNNNKRNTTCPVVPVSCARRGTFECVGSGPVSTRFSNRTAGGRQLFGDNRPNENRKFLRPLVPLRPSRRVRPVSDSRHISLMMIFFFFLRYLLSIPFQSKTLSRAIFGRPVDAFFDLPTTGGKKFVTFTQHRGFPLISINFLRFGEKQS